MNAEGHDAKRIRMVCQSNRQALRVIEIEAMQKAEELSRDRQRREQEGERRQ